MIFRRGDLSYQELPLLTVSLTLEKHICYAFLKLVHVHFIIWILYYSRAKSFRADWTRSMNMQKLEHANTLQNFYYSPLCPHHYHFLN